MLLFIPSTNPSVKLMSSLASWLNSQGMESALVVNPQQQDYLRSVEKCSHTILDFKTLRPIRINSVTPASAVTGKDPFTPPLAAVRTSRLQALHQVNNSLVIAVLAAYWLLQILRFRLLWSKRIRALGCRVAFVWGDNAGTTNGELLNLMKNSGAMLVHLPVAISDQNIIARLRSGSNIYRLTPRTAILSRLLARFFPGQAFDFESGRILYYHPSEAWAMALLGVLPLAPWILGGSRADFVYLADTAQRDYWIKRGTPANNARVIGNLDKQDAKSEMIRLCKSHEILLRQQKRLVLINMPNLVEHSVISDWDQFWIEVRKMLTPCIQNDVLMVVSLHPKSEPRNYDWLERAYGCLVTKGDIGAWIGLADLYVSACSTTELIASELGVPVIDIGAIYMFESEVLHLMPNICFVSDYDEYRLEIRKVLDVPKVQPARFREVDEIVGTGEVGPFQRVKELLATEILGNH
jgi:hypothetical protein